jgi:hypothetical protein
MSEARAGLGVNLVIDEVHVAELSSVGGINPTRETIDVSNHDTDNDGYREFLGSIKDAGEFDVEGNYVNADPGQAKVLACFESGKVVPVEISFPMLTGESTMPKWECDCIVTSVTRVGDATIDAQLTFAATFKISGKPTFTDATLE